MAMVIQNDDEVNRIINDTVGEMTRKYLNIAREYCLEDLPFAVASMQIAARSLAAILPESGRQIAEEIAGGTESIVVDLTEMKKQMQKEDDPDGKMDKK